LRVLLCAAARELAWGLRLGSQELARWRDLALEIPDPGIRRDALLVLRRKRTHAHGAALFCILPRRRHPELVRLLVAYELIWDFLDNLSERAAAAGYTDGYALHLAIAEAIDPGSPVSDYYSCLPWKEDGGYLRALVASCREHCCALPSYPSVRELTVRDAHLAQVLALNHEPNPVRRDASLRAWVAGHFPGNDAPWWELSGAASAPLAIHALLALAAEPRCADGEVAAVHAAYFPWVAAATTMLDSYVDRPDDVVIGAHSYVAHYPDACRATCCVRSLLHRALSEVRALERGTKHLVIVAAMAAMYLSKGAATPEVRDLVLAGGSLTRMLLPVLRLWRGIFGQTGV